MKQIKKKLNTTIYLEDIETEKFELILKIQKYPRIDNIVAQPYYYLYYHYYCLINYIIILK